MEKCPRCKGVLLLDHQDKDLVCIACGARVTVGESILIQAARAQNQKRRGPTRRGQRL